VYNAIGVPFAITETYYGVSTSTNNPFISVITNNLIVFHISEYLSISLIPLAALNLYCNCDVLFAFRE